MFWKNPSTSTGIEPANLGSRGEYDNHWTTGVDSSDVLKVLIAKINTHEKKFTLSKLYL